MFYWSGLRAVETYTIIRYKSTRLLSMTGKTNKQTRHAEGAQLRNHAKGGNSRKLRSMYSEAVKK